MSDAIYWPCADVLILGRAALVRALFPPPSDLRQRMIDVLDRMVGAARAAGVPEADIAEARYALVAFIDEQILKSSWPGRAEWMNQPLQLMLYREYTAGENFFARMRALLNQGGRQVRARDLLPVPGARLSRGVRGERPARRARRASPTRRASSSPQRLPSGGKISPHAQPPRSRRREKSKPGALIALLVGLRVRHAGHAWSRLRRGRFTPASTTSLKAMPAKPPAAAHSG